MSTTTAIAPKEKFLQLVEESKKQFGLADHQRDAAVEFLNHFEIPTTRDEEWKYTRTTKLSNESWKWSNDHSVETIIPYRIPKLNALELVFVNGKFSQELSSNILLDGLTFMEGATLVSNEANQNAPANFFEAFQRATTTGAIYLEVAPKVALEKHIHIIHLITGTNTVSTPLIVLNLQANSKLSVTESFCGNTKGLTIRRLSANVAANARLEYNKIQNEGDEHYLINIEEVAIDRDGYSNLNTLTVAGGWVRNDLRIALNGENIEANLSGFYLPRNKQHIDNHTKVDHKLPHCVSNELYKGILFDSSTGVFNGKVYVWKDAQKTNAYQNNANIIAGDNAVMNTKPELEIYADDVKCSHGTTTGQLDEQAMFYLRARGMSPDSARKLLTTAFINDVLNKVDEEVVREYVIQLLVEKELLTL
jgi:Fe-S cluster assembly protein SufD